MNVEALREYCLVKKGVSETFPFDGDTLVFKVMDKMYALLPLERQPTQLNLKCDPDRAIELRETYDGAILPGYHMNKKHWNTIYTEQVDPQLLMQLIDHSYELVVAKLSKAVRAELDTLSGGV
ncbi:MAG: MmcQ/YjbR family DNA-binding protein [Bacteroidota bacterium]